MDVDHAEFIPWSNMILSKVNKIISPLKTKIKSNKFPKKSIFKQHVIKNLLLDLHSKFVIVPIDKAANNVAII